MNAEDDKKRTPLHWAANRHRLLLHDEVVEKGNIAAIEALLNKGAEVNAEDDEKYTPLHVAALN